MYCINWRCTALGCNNICSMSEREGGREREREREACDVYMVTLLQDISFKTNVDGMTR